MARFTLLGSCNAKQTIGNCFWNPHFFNANTLTKNVSVILKVWDLFHLAQYQRGNWGDHTALEGPQPLVGFSAKIIYFFHTLLNHNLPKPLANICSHSVLQPLASNKLVHKQERKKSLTHCRFSLTPPLD